MDLGYEQYCLSDEAFYDSPTEARGDDVDFDIAGRPVAAGWRQVPSDDWLVHWPAEGARTPPQGWKVHVSACLDNAEAVLATVFDYCVPRRIPFKYVRSLQLLLLRNAKYADRGASGKFVTIYPNDEAELETVVSELGAVLAGQPGPYILSDLRIGDGPLYVRWGGFAERYCTGPRGTLELAVADPDGELVPDVRGPCFSLPPWVELPAFLAPHLEARNRPPGEELHYDIDSALHFSNGGGIYVGADQRTGRKVVLKEARPHAGLAFDGVDAVARLRNEAEALERLSGIDAVPDLVEVFTVGEHHFLAQEYVEGARLNDLMVQRYPLTAPERDDAAMAAYAEWALDVLGQIERAVEAIHGRGIAILDLHPSNVLVRPDGRVVLVDFELAGPADERRRATLADPGFMAPGDRRGVEIDRYALACFRLYLFLPLNNLYGMAPGKARQLADEIAELFPVPRDYLREAARTIAGTGDGPARAAVGVWPRLDPDGAGWHEARDSMVRAIVASATPEREGRLFPGDVKQFAVGGLNLAYGAAGVLLALAEAGGGRRPEFEGWLLERASRPEPGTRLGFYDGLHGVAYALDHLGHHREARELVELCVAELDGKHDAFGLDLFGGLAGVGLNLLHFADRTGDANLRREAWRAADVLAGRLGAVDDVGELSGGPHPHAGLLRGSAGPALLFLRLFEASGDGALLELAEVALRQDLRRCLRRDDGTLEVNEGWRSMPYLCDGSVGIGMVLDDYLVHRPDDDGLADAARALRRAARSQFYIEPGLFYGRAGMVLYLSRGRGHLDGPAPPDPVVADHIRRLAWHALTFRGDLAFPGEQLLRLSMDLASGTAGVLLALAAALHDEPVGLPFLGPAAVHSTVREPVPA